MADSTDPNAGGAPTAPATPNNPATKPAESGPAAGVPAADMQAQINQALAVQQAEFSKQLKAATGHGDLKALTEAQLEAQGKLQELADSRKLEAEKAKSDLVAVKIENALLAASTGAINPSLVYKLLSEDAVYDDNGAVTVAGKSVADAVKEFLKDNPFLAKPQGGTGSGAPQSAPVDGAQNNETLSPQQRLINARKGQG